MKAVGVAGRKKSQPFDRLSPLCVRVGTDVCQSDDVDTAVLNLDQQRGGISLEGHETSYYETTKKASSMGGWRGRRSWSAKRRDDNRKSLRPCVTVEKY